MSFKQTTVKFLGWIAHFLLLYTVTISILKEQISYYLNGPEKIKWHTVS